MILASATLCVCKIKIIVSTLGVFAVPKANIDSLLGFKRKCVGCEICINLKAEYRRKSDNFLTFLFFSELNFNDKTKQVLPINFSKLCLIFN